MELPGNTSINILNYILMGNQEVMIISILSTKLNQARESQFLNNYNVTLTYFFLMEKY